MFTDMVGYTALAQRNEALASNAGGAPPNSAINFFSALNGTEIKTIG